MLICVIRQLHDQNVWKHDDAPPLYICAAVQHAILNYVLAYPVASWLKEDSSHVGYRMASNGSLTLAA